jgi:hypothetical protein
MVLENCGDGQSLRKYVRFEVFMAVTMKNAIFWVVTLRDFCKSQCCRGMYHHHQVGVGTSQKMASLKKYILLSGVHHHHLHESRVLW